MPAIRHLEDHDLNLVLGGGNFFADLGHDISRALGREGKPFIGRDFVEVGAGVATTFVSGGNASAGAAASAAVKAAYDAKRKTGKIGELVNH